MNSRILLVGGLGHTDLSGKVPRPGLLMLRKALKQAGHEGVVANYAASLMPRMFPPRQVEQLAKIYKRTVRPLVVEGKKPLNLPRLLWDLRQLKRISRDLIGTEKQVFEELGSEIAERVRRENFEAVGFSLYLGSSTTGALAMADVIRREIPDLPIIFGGPQTTHFAEAIYRETESPTALVVGEGELSLIKIAELVQDLKAGKLGDLSQVPNLVYRTHRGQIIATARKRLPFKDWVALSHTPYEEADFEGLLKYAFIETSRGCSYLCHFCPQPLLSGSQRYLKPAAAIVDEMVLLHRRFGINHFEMVGSSTPPSQAEKIAQELLARGLGDKFRWVLFMRGRDEGGADSDLSIMMRKLKQAGAEAIFFGVEAADNETLAKMGKKERIEDTQAALLAARDAGIAVIGSFIYPYPGMPANEGEMILDFLREVRPLSAPVQSLGLFPGTYDAEHAQELGCEIVYPESADQALYLAGKKDPPTLQSPEVLRYLLRYPLILSLPMRFWPPLPYKIDGRSFKEYVREVNRLQAKISALGILTGFSHTHHLISRVLNLSPADLFERMFYCSLTGDPETTNELIARFKQGIAPSPPSPIPGS